MHAVGMLLEPAACAGWAKALGIQASEQYCLRALLPVSHGCEANCWVVEVEGLALDGLPQAFVCTSCQVAAGTQLVLGWPPAQPCQALGPPAAAPAAVSQVLSLCRSVDLHGSELPSKWP